MFSFFFNAFYRIVQYFIILLFKPTPPPPGKKLKKPHGRIAVIGAGLTGVSSAAHAIAHGFEVVIFESNDRVGGIWSHVNSTSSLQLNSLLYRFHPAVSWSRTFPYRDEILSEVKRIWQEYQLEQRTHFNTPVTSVRRAPKSGADPSDYDPSKLGHARWLINDGQDGVFDAVIVTVGTCGKPQWVRFPGMPAENNDEPQNDTSADEGSGSDNEVNKHGAEAKEDPDVFRGPILHSSQLDTISSSTVRGKTVLVIGSGASGVEAAETALARGAAKCIMLARDDKWIIPRNIVFDTLIAMQPFGREMPLSGVLESFLARTHYCGASTLVPNTEAGARGLFEGTPVVNDAFIEHVRTGQCEYVRGETQRFTKRGVQANVRSRDMAAGEKGEEKEIEGDVVVLATGFEKPDVGFLPGGSGKDNGEGSLFPEGYERPDLYLQNFATEDWSVLMTNSAYVNAIGTVGHFHIGMYTRVLLTLLLDRSARPTPHDMRLWVDVVRFIKRGARGGALGFFTYMELTIWLLLFHVLRIDRIRWVFFIMQGWGVHPQWVDESVDDKDKGKNRVGWGDANRPGAQIRAGSGSGSTS